MSSEWSDLSCTSCVSPKEQKTWQCHWSNANQAIPVTKNGGLPAIGNTQAPKSNTTPWQLARSSGSVPCSTSFINVLKHPMHLSHSTSEERLYRERRLQGECEGRRYTIRRERRSEVDRPQQATPSAAWGQNAHPGRANPKGPDLKHQMSRWRLIIEFRVE